MRRMCVCAVAVCLVLVAAPAVAAWDFSMVESATPEVYGVDGRFYENDGVTLVKTGALVQFIVALDGAEIVDPYEHFDYNHNGYLDWGSAEFAGVLAWVRNGADPSELDPSNVLATAVGFSGEATLDAPGYLLVDAYAETGSPYSIVPGATFDRIAYRVWNLSKEELEAFGTEPLTEVWCLTGRELTSHDNQGGGPDTGWWIGMPGFDGGGAPAPEDWTGLNSLIGWEVLNGLRYQYRMDTLLAVCIPEPGMVVVMGCAVVVMLMRRKR